MAIPVRTGRAYAIAGLIGLFALFSILNLATILGTGGFWTYPAADAAVGLTGHLAYQAPGWHWPLLLAPALAWPEGRSIALTDSNPLVSLAAKCAAIQLGHPVNLFGAWLAACWILQPIAAVYSLRGLRPNASWEATTGVAALSLLCPAWLARHNHINLLGHFLLLAALGLSARMALAPRPRPWWPAGALLAVSVLIHPYLYVCNAVVLAAPAIAQATAAGSRRWRPFAPWLVACALPVILLLVLSGALGGNAPGYGHYSMNLLSPVWPQRSGLFGPRLPILDATGGQYEGFNYQGAGVLLLAATAALLLFRRPITAPPTRTRLLAMAIPLACLTLLALTPRIYAGPWLVLPLPRQPWRQIFGVVQSSGRAFWPVGYALMLGAVACVDARLRRPARLGVLAAALVLQIIDSAPLRADSTAFFSGLNEAPPPFAIPPDARLLRIVPACDPAKAPADLLRLLAIRQGLAVADMRLAHQPSDAICRKELSDGLNIPLAEGELRLFLPAAAASVRSATLGADVVCRRTAPGLVCARLLPGNPP